MKALTFLPRCGLQRPIERALSSAHFVVETAASAEECLQFAQVTPYEATLVDADSLNFGDLLTLLKLLRPAHQKASLFVFGRYLHLKQRLRLFEARVDDCVREPFYATELAVRLCL